jgi:hypothetical protein
MIKGDGLYTCDLHYDNNIRKNPPKCNCICILQLYAPSNHLQLQLVIFAIIF